MCDSINIANTRNLEDGIQILSKEDFLRMTIDELSYPIFSNLDGKFYRRTIDGKTDYVYCSDDKKDIISHEDLNFLFKHKTIYKNPDQYSDLEIYLRSESKSSIGFSTILKPYRKLCFTSVENLNIIKIPDLENLATHHIIEQNLSIKGHLFLKRRKIGETIVKYGNVIYLIKNRDIINNGVYLDYLKSKEVIRDFKISRRKLYINLGDISDPDGLLALKEYLLYFTDREVVFILHYPGYLKRTGNDLRNVNINDENEMFRFKKSMEVINGESVPSPDGYTYSLEEYIEFNYKGEDLLFYEKLKIILGTSDHKELIKIVTIQMLKSMMGDKRIKIPLYFVDGEINDVNPFSINRIKDDLLPFAKILFPGILHEIRDPEEYRINLDNERQIPDTCSNDNNDKLFEQHSGIIEITIQELIDSLCDKTDVYLDHFGSMASMTRKLSSAIFPHLRKLTIMGSVEFGKTPSTMQFPFLSRHPAATMNGVYSISNFTQFMEDFVEYQKRTGEKIPTEIISNNEINENYSLSFEQFYKILLYEDFLPQADSMFATYIREYYSKQRICKAFDLFAAVKANGRFHSSLVKDGKGNYVIFNTIHPNSKFRVYKKNAAFIYIPLKQILDNENLSKEEFDLVIENSFKLEHGLEYIEYTI